RVARMRYNTSRFGQATTPNTSNGRGVTNGAGTLAWSVNRGAPVTLAQQSMFCREDGVYTLTFRASISPRPSSARAFMAILRNAGTAARISFGQEDHSTVTWMGWCNSGDRFDFTSYYAGTGTYTQGSTISVLYHGQ
ncbi:MAG: hypothetical protein ACTH02_09525, partial [Corynebacterium sp.]